MCEHHVKNKRVAEDLNNAGQYNSPCSQVYTLPCALECKKFCIYQQGHIHRALKSANVALPHKGNEQLRKVFTKGGCWNGNKLFNICKDIKISHVQRTQVLLCPLPKPDLKIKNAHIYTKVLIAVQMFI
eukprot:717927-Pelagomonas_calceolata.AAC.1